MDETLEETYEKKSEGMSPEGKAKTRVIINRQKEEYKSLSALVLEEQEINTNAAEDLAKKVMEKS